jgi:uncharacterized protein (DUF2384 family)
MVVMNEAEKALVYVELRELFEPWQVRTWLETPHGLLEDRQPQQCSFREVLRVIDTLKSGAFA